MSEFKFLWQRILDLLDKEKTTLQLSNELNISRDVVRQSLVDMRKEGIVFSRRKPYEKKTLLFSKTGKEYSGKKSVKYKFQRDKKKASERILERYYFIYDTLKEKKCCSKQEVIEKWEGYPVDFSFEFGVLSSFGFIKQEFISSKEKVYKLGDVKMIRFDLLSGKKIIGKHDFPKDREKLCLDSV